MELDPEGESWERPWPSSIHREMLSAVPLAGFEAFWTSVVGSRPVGAFRPRLLSERAIETAHDTNVSAPRARVDI